MTAWVVLDPEFAENRGDMGLDGRLGDVELPGDLLVEAAIPQHDEYLVLLGSEAGQLGGEIRPFAGLGMEEMPSGTQLSPPDHRIEGADQLFHGNGFGNEAERAQAQHLLDDGGILEAETTTMGRSGVMSAQIGQPLEAVGPRHLEIQQQQVDVGMFIEQVAQAVDGVSLQQSGVVDGHVHRLIEGAPKQGVVICDDDGKLAVHSSHCC
jgi:hypothetical protein